MLTTIVVLAALGLLNPGRAVAAPVLITPSSLHVMGVTAAGSLTCALELNGEVACWGPGSEAPPDGTGPLTQISSNAQTCGIQQDKSIICWGFGWSPQQVDGAYVAVSAGYYNKCAIDETADIACWGSDPQALEHIAGPFTSLTVGYSHACAIKADMSIACWGSNEEGQAPAAVAGSFVSVSAAASHTCAVETDGDLRCWGDNTGGRAPASVQGSFTTVSAGTLRSCALRDSGGVVCYGAALSGAAAQEEVPGPFKAVAAGDSHVCAIRTDDLVSCWGDRYALPTPPGLPTPARFVSANEGAPYLQLFSVPTTSAVRVTVDGTLPAGLTIVDDAYADFGDRFELSGTPQRRGSSTFTLVATNLFGESRSTVTLRVIPAPRFDVNGDGLPDLPVGAPGENVGSTVDAGAVTVLLGAADGTYEGAVMITQESVGQRSETSDRFGAAIAVGEVTGDDFADLIIGAPGEDKGAGQVIVVHGVAKGSAGAKRTVLRQGLAGADGAAEAGDGFGSAISVNNELSVVNGLWVGAPGEDLGAATDAGVATRFLTAPLRTTGSVEYQQGKRNVPGAPEKGDRFGAALAGGGAMIGAPGEDVGRIVDAGSVTGQLSYALTQDSEGVPGSAEAGDQFGAALATSAELWMTDTEDDWFSFHEIGIGAPGEDIGSIKDAGMIVSGSDEIFDYDEEAAGVEAGVQNDWQPARAEQGDRFGASITLSTDGNRIVIGAPGEDVGSVKDAGAVSVLSLCDSCSGGADIYATLDQNSGGVPGSVRAGSQFGAVVAERPNASGGYVVGAPGENVGGHPGAGAVVVMPTKGAAQELHQDSAGVPGAAEDGDRFATTPGR